MRRFTGCLVIWVVFGVISGSLWAQPQARELLQNIEQVWGTQGYAYQAELVVHEKQGSKTRHLFFLTMPAPHLRSLLRCSEPRCTILKVDNTFWQYRPSQEGVVLQTPHEKFLASEFTIADLAGALELGQYNWKTLGQSPYYTQKYKEPVWIVEGINPQAHYPKLRLAVMAKDGVILRKVFFDSAMKITRILAGSRLQKVVGETLRLPMTWLMIDVATNRKSEYTITKFFCPIEVRPDLLSKQNLKQLSELKLVTQGKAYTASLPSIKKKTPTHPLQKVNNQCPTYFWGYKPLNFFCRAYPRYHQAEGNMRYLWIALLCVCLIGDILVTAVLGVGYLLQQQWGQLAFYIYGGALVLLLLLSFFVKRMVVMLLLLLGVTGMGLVGGWLIGGNLGAIIGGGCGLLLSIWEGHSRRKSVVLVYT